MSVSKLESKMPLIFCVTLAGGDAENAGPKMWDRKMQNHAVTSISVLCVQMRLREWEPPVPCAALQ